MKILKYALFLITFFLFQNATNAQEWTSFKSQKQIHDLVDKGGELFMATDAGLVVLNKSTLEKAIFSSANSNLSKNEIIAITEAPNGDIWVGTLNGSIERFDGTDFLDASTPDDVNFDSNTELFDLKIATNGDFWCATNDGVFHKSGQTWSHYGQGDLGANFFEAWDIAISDAGEVFVATNEVFKFGNGTWTNILGTSQIQNYLDSDLFISSNGDLYVAGDLSKIGRFDGVQWQVYTLPIGNGSHIKRFTEDTNGDIYIESQYDGIFKLVNDAWVAELDAQISAADNQVTHFYIDSQNKRWLNTNIHLSVNDAGTVQSTTISQHTLETDIIYNISKGNDGAMYFVTGINKLISKVDAAGNWSSLSTPTALSTFEALYDILVLNANDIWLATQNGLYHYDGSVWTLTITGLCKGIEVDSQGKIYVLGSVQVHIINNGVVTEYNVSNSVLSGPYMAGIGIDANDNLWIAEGEINTIQKVSNTGTWTTFTQANHPLLNKPGGKFHFDANGNTWIPSSGLGALKFDGTAFTNPYVGNVGAMENSEVLSIESDATGKIFFAHQYGMTSLLDGQWEDLLIGDVPAVATSADSKIEFDDAGNLWWGSSREGVFSFGMVAILPIDLTSLKAQARNKNSVQLSWQTASEINNDFFLIEHSIDGRDFSEVGKENGNGTSSIFQNYTFIHENVGVGKHYYRLKQIDFDGTFQYTNIVTASIEKGDTDIYVMPNPTSGVISIEAKTALERNTDLQIFNTQGQLVYSDIMQNGQDNLRIDISDLPQGIYYLRMLVSAELITQKIIKE